MHVQLLQCLLSTLNIYSYVHSLSHICLLHICTCGYYVPSLWREYILALHLHQWGAHQGTCLKALSTWMSSHSMMVFGDASSSSIMAPLTSVLLPAWGSPSSNLPSGLHALQLCEHASVVVAHQECIIMHLLPYRLWMLLLNHSLTYCIHCSVGV